MLKRTILLLSIAIFTGSLLVAQITTSAITGSVTNTTGESLVGATITATHQPTATKYVMVTKGGGVFKIDNMRTGGPYLIEVSHVGYDPERYSDVYLQLAESFLLNSVLSKTNATLENVVLTTGGRSKILNANRTGAVTNIGIRQIRQLPTVSRSLNDFTRATPQASNKEGAIAGGNFRQNNFTIDGSDFNNSFGIGGNLPASGAPISLDAIEEISVNITPYDVRQSGFIGSAINAVTRSGTNKWTATFYNYFRNQKQRGDKVGNTKFVRPPEEFDMWGASLGGPIIRNKLFFFVNYEKETQPKTLQTRVASTAGAPFGSSPNIARPTADSLNYISQFLRDNYDYETGPFDNYTTDILREKIMGRLDWTINSRNRFNVRYSQVEGGEPFSISNSVGGTGLTNLTGLTRIDNNALWYKNSNYFQGGNFYSFAAELNSKFGNVSNTLRGTYTYQNDSRSSDGKLFPTVDIMSSTGVSAAAPYTTFGYDPFSFMNLRQVKTYSFTDYVSWTKNKHNWTFGAQVDISKTINGFNPFGASYYRFATWDDFASGANPTDFAITYSLSKDFAPALSAFKFAQYTLYGQDEIAITKNFRLTVGLRVDQPSYPDIDEVKTNPLLLGLDFNGEKINTGNLPSKRLMWSPRVGFNWDLYGDRSLQIRGGTGIFTGKVPFVWIVSQSGTNGMILVTVPYNGQSNTPGPFSPDPNAYRPSAVPPAGTIIPATVTALDKDFKNPQSWKSSLAMDTKLPWGIICTVEGIYNKDMNTVFFRDPNYVTPEALNVDGYPDNRAIYPAFNTQRYLNPLINLVPVAPGTVPNPNNPVASNNDAGPLDPIVLDNGKRGYYASLTIKFEKLFTKGFFASVAYTKSIAGNLHDGTGDQPAGTYQGTQQVNGLNKPVLSYASYMVPDRVIAAVSYRREYIKHLATAISLLYQGSIDGRFSYVYGGDFNRDRIIGNDLIYIPKDPSEITFVNSAATNGVVYTPQQQSDLFFKYIDQDKYLRKHKGQYAERNGARYPWRNQVDAKFLQDIFVNVGKERNTIQFSIDIFNFGNLLNSDWGKVKVVNAASLLVPQNTAALVPGGTVKPTFRLATDRGNMVTQTFRDNVSTLSTYSIQFGLRYMFN